MSKEPCKKILVIGASAGAIEALSVLLPELRKDLSFAVIIVVHLPPDKPSVLPELFKPKCQLDVVEAEDKATLTPGVVYFAPPDYHVLIESEGMLSLSSDEAVLFSRPSIDVLFESAADAYAENVIGIILTGANSDGAEGLRMIADHGGETIVQKPETALASPMPEAALKACQGAMCMDLQEIATYLNQQSAIAA